ncbi:hypothetical protein GPROT1_02944 [Gammaproteobacteria bacterium]|nr:hypothetical protein GPROT1_02944 [Gammaproteobacteria bacterium]
MYAFCTYCSKDKRDTPGDIPAIQRYLSSRISHVYNAARELGLAFFILSGEYGLISPDYALPWYDHLLLRSEVSSLASRVIEQLAQHDVTRLVYFTQSFARDPNIVPYHAVIVEACNRIGVPIFVVEIDETSLTSQSVA